MVRTVSTYCKYIQKPFHNCDGLIPQLPSLDATNAQGKLDMVLEYLGMTDTHVVRMRRPQGQLLFWLSYECRDSYFSRRTTVQLANPGTGPSQGTSRQVCYQDPDYQWKGCIGTVVRFVGKCTNVSAVCCRHIATLWQRAGHVLQPWLSCSRLWKPGQVRRAPTMESC